MDKVVHFEIPVDDGIRAREFYGSVFDWELNEVDMGGGATYTTVTTVPVDDRMMPKEPGAINGGMMARKGDPSSPVITVQVDPIDKTLKKIEAGGGSTVMPRTPIPGMRLRLLQGQRGQYDGPVGDRALTTSGRR